MIIINDSVIAPKVYTRLKKSSKYFNKMARRCEEGNHIWVSIHNPYRVLCK